MITLINQKYLYQFQNKIFINCDFFKQSLDMDEFKNKKTSLRKINLRIFFFFENICF